MDKQEVGEHLSLLRINIHCYESVIRFWRTTTIILVVVLILTVTVLVVSSTPAVYNYFSYFVGLFYDQLK